MAHLESEIDDILNVSDIPQPSINEKASDDDFLKGISGDENDADSPQKQSDSNIQISDLNDDDTGVGLPSSFLFDSNAENQDNIQDQLGLDLQLPTEQDQIDNLDNHKLFDSEENNENNESITQQEQNGQQEQQNQLDQQDNFDTSEKVEQVDQNEDATNADDNNQQDELGLPEINENNVSNNENNDENHDLSDNTNPDSEDGVEALSPTKEKSKTVQSPSSKKNIQTCNSKSFQDFINRNDNCNSRHYDKSVERLPSPHTLRYTNSCKEPPKVQGTPDKRPKRVQELFDESIKLGPCNSNYAIPIGSKKNNADNNDKTSSPSSPRQAKDVDQQNSDQQNDKKANTNQPMSEASTILANSKFDRIIDLTVGKKANLTKSQVNGILRKFFIRSEEDRSEILKSCGGDDENDNQRQDNENNNSNEENDENNENKTYSAQSLKAILKQAASAEGGSKFIRKIRPIVRAALFDMKQPIVSPMTQKQRAAMNFDQTLRSSLKKQPNSPIH